MVWPQTKAFRLISIAVFPLLILSFVFIYTWDAVRYQHILREDGWIEWLTFTFAMLAGLLSWDIFIQIRQRERRTDWFFIAFGLFCILMALEEISWGQRVFSLQSPDFFLGRSDQQEINVHNVLQQQLDIKTTDVAAIVLVGYGLFLPLLAYNPRIGDLFKRIGLIVPPLFLIGGFLLAGLLMQDEPTGWEEELGEFFFALCFLLFMLHELGKRSPAGRLQPFRLPSLHINLSARALDGLTVGTLTLVAFVLRFWQLGRKGLWLGEAVNALAAQVTVVDIIQRNWQSATIQPPTWTLLLHAWTLVSGSSEASMRFLPALIGALSVPLLWQILKTVAYDDWALRAIAALLLALSSSLLYFAQDVAVYSTLVTVSLLSLYVALQLVKRPASWWLPLFVTVNWLMLSLHLYTATILIAESIFFIYCAVTSPRDIRSRWAPVGAGLLLSYLPLLLWAFLAPQFWRALDLLSSPLLDDDWTMIEHVGRLWRDLIFGSVLSQPPLAGRSYLFLPFVLVGGWALITKIRAGNTRDGDIDPTAWATLLLSIVLIPLLPAVFVLQGIPSGVLMVAVPGLLILSSMGVLYLWRRIRLFGLAGLALLVSVMVMGIVFYFVIYEKSAYREMAAYIAARIQPEDGLVIETHQQYPLTHYYLNDNGTIRSIPEIELSDYWIAPVDTVVPEDVDDQLQGYLRQHPSLWLILSGEKTVDPNSFVRQYLTAVSHRMGCTEWLDIELCQFTSPHNWQPIVQRRPNARYGNELLLENVSIGLTSEQFTDWPALLLTMDWLALSQPSVDYTVSLRLTDEDGVIVAQRDSLPIGTLLPPTTWRAGDRKPGYMALQLPDTLEPGEYTVQTVVYDPANGNLLPAEFEEGGRQEKTITWAVVTVSDSIELLEAE